MVSHLLETLSPMQSSKDIHESIDKLKRIQINVSEKESKIIDSCISAIDKMLDELAKTRVTNMQLVKMAVTSEFMKEYGYQSQAQKWETLLDWARKNNNKEIINIMANGTPDVNTPPTYAQQLNLAKHGAYRAEAHVQVLLEALGNGQLTIHGEHQLMHYLYQARVQYEPKEGIEHYNRITEIIKQLEKAIEFKYNGL